MLDKAKLVGKKLCQGKSYCESGGIFCALFLVPKIKCCLFITEFSKIEEHKTFKSFSDSKRLLNRSQ